MALTLKMPPTPAFLDFDKYVFDIDREVLVSDINDLKSVSGSDLWRDLALASMARIQTKAVNYPIHILVRF